MSTFLKEADTCDLCSGTTVTVFKQMAKLHVDLQLWLGAGHTGYLENKIFSYWQFHNRKWSHLELLKGIVVAHLNECGKYTRHFKKIEEPSQPLLHPNPSCKT